MQIYILVDESLIVGQRRLQASRVEKMGNKSGDGGQEGGAEIYLKFAKIYVCNISVIAGQERLQASSGDGGQQGEAAAFSHIIHYSVPALAIPVIFSTFYIPYKLYKYIIYYPLYIYLSPLFPYPSYFSTFHIS